MKTSFLDQKKLPMLVEPPETSRQNADLATLISTSRKDGEFFRSKLLEHGALLFRGYSIDSTEEFEQFVVAFSGKKLLDYVGGASPRVELGSGVYTSTEYPAQVMLALHNELSYSHNYPKNLYFCCLIPAQNGGETPIADSRAILEKLDSKVVGEFKKRKIRYDRNLSADAGSGYSWQDAFETADKAKVESYCREADINFRWKDDGGLFLSQVLPATATHPETGEEVWFNQADGFHPSSLDAATYQTLIANRSEEEFRLNSRFGDGAPLDVSMLEHIREVVRNEMIVFQWQKGDVLVLDNLLTAHGRMPFSGARKIILAMT